MKAYQGNVNNGIDLITWTVTGKVSEVIFASSKDDLSFRYDPMGNRIAKIQKPKNWTDEEEWTITWYARDAQGNVLAVYSKPEDSLNFHATEFNIFGSSRIGMVTQPEALSETPQVPMALSQTLGLKVYEFSNHLGNVLTTFSDRKIATEGTPGYVAHYTAEILSSTDYYPFGFQMSGRVYQGSYRFGFNGMEKDDEVKGSGNSYTTEFRMLDVRIGRWWSLDPVVHHFQSPYCTFDNNPIFFQDPDGRDAKTDGLSRKEQRKLDRRVNKFDRQVRKEMRKNGLNSEEAFETVYNRNNNSTNSYMFLRFPSGSGSTRQNRMYNVGYEWFNRQQEGSEETSSLILAEENVQGSNINARESNQIFDLPNPPAGTGYSVTSVSISNVTPELFPGDVRPGFLQSAVAIDTRSFPFESTELVNNLALNSDSPPIQMNVPGSTNRIILTVIQITGANQHRVAIYSVTFTVMSRSNPRFPQSHFIFGGGRIISREAVTNEILFGTNWFDDL